MFSSITIDIIVIISFFLAIHYYLSSSKKQPIEQPTVVTSTPPVMLPMTNNEIMQHNNLTNVPTHNEPPNEFASIDIDDLFSDKRSPVEQIQDDIFKPSEKDDPYALTRDTTSNHDTQSIRANTLMNSNDHEAALKAIHDSRSNPALKGQTIQSVYDNMTKDLRDVIPQTGFEPIGTQGTGGFSFFGGNDNVTNMNDTYASFNNNNYKLI
jgi:hypothetical protein